MKNNKGITLVELLVALSIGAILLTGLSTMLISSLTMTGKSNITIDLQREAQATINLISDSSMEATGLKIVENSSTGQTQIMYLGDFIPYHDGSNDRLRYEGKVILNAENTTDGWRELYVAEYRYPGTSEMSVAGADVAIARRDLETGILNDMTDSGAVVGELKYLLAKHVTEFVVKVDLEGLTGNEFQGNITLDIGLEFENAGGKSVATSKVSKNVQLRNRVEVVEIDKGDGNPMQEFKLQ